MGGGVSLSGILGNASTTLLVTAVNNLAPVVSIKPDDILTVIGNLAGEGAVNVSGILRFNGANANTSLVINRGGQIVIPAEAGAILNNVSLSASGVLSIDASNLPVGQDSQIRIPALTTCTGTISYTLRNGLKFSDLASLKSNISVFSYGSATAANRMNFSCSVTVCDSSKVCNTIPTNTQPKVTPARSFLTTFSSYVTGQAMHTLADSPVIASWGSDSLIIGPTFNPSGTGGTNSASVMTVSIMTFLATLFVTLFNFRC